MTQSKSGGGKRWLGIALAIVVLTAILALLFLGAFEREQVVFSNDGPLGVANSEALQLPGAFSGYWTDLFWIGANGSYSPVCPTSVIRWLLGPVGYARFYPLFSLLFLGLSAWIFFRAIGLSSALCTVGGIAAALNSNFFSNTCWGLGSRALTLACVFLALAALSARHVGNRWINAALAGLATGMAVVEGADNGVIFSLFVAAFVVWQALAECSPSPSERAGQPTPSPSQEGKLKPIPDPSQEGKSSAGAKAGSPPGRGQGWVQPAGQRAFGCALLTGFVRLVLVTGFAGFIATQSLISLVGLAAKTSVSAEADAQTKEQKWAFATQWSLPPMEMLRVIIPGVHGYRMDTSEGGNYWGRVGEAPGAPQQMPRYSGAGEYAGVLVVLLAVWSFVASFSRGRSPLTPALSPSAGARENAKGAAASHRGRSSDAATGISAQGRSAAASQRQLPGSWTGSAFTDSERKLIWFWAAMFVVAMLLSWGRFAPFYQIVYALPYFSSIRNPMKFMHAGHMALMILFGYGLLGLSRRYLEGATSTGAIGERIRSWWAKAQRFEKRWTYGMFAAVAASLLAFLLYSSAQSGLAKHLTNVGFADPGQAGQIAKFSIGEVGKFFLFFVISVAVVFLIMGGVFAGARARWAAVLLGLILTLDLARANAPWIVYWDYKNKYATNPIIDALRTKPHEGRVVAPAFLMDARGGLPPEKRLAQAFSQVYGIEWVQHLFQYYNIQSIDVAQDPRPPADKEAFLKAMSRDMMRYWELTNTRYVLGLAGYLDALNSQMDKGRNRFRIAQRFDIAPKPNLPNPSKLEDLTALPSPDGALALFEFAGALPRAKLYSRWQVVTDNEATLKMLTDATFDPHATVLVGGDLPASSTEATNNPASTVEISSYSPRRIELRANAAAPSVLLLNDRYDRDWRVTVDGQPATLLRCNFIMRGVQVPVGEHTVVFEFHPSLTGLKVSLAAIGIGVVLGALLLFVRQPDTVPLGMAPGSPKSSD